MKKSNSKQIIILHCGYPKAASTTITKDISDISKKTNVVDVNENQDLLNCFEKILKLNDNLYLKQKKLLTILIKRNLKKGINFLCHERILNINLEFEKKILFLKRLKLIFRELNYTFRVSIYVRNQPDILISTFKEGFVKIIFKKFTNIIFSNYINSINNDPNQVLFNNLNYYKSIKKISRIIQKKNIYLGLFEEIEVNKKKEFIKILKFCKIKSFNLKLLSTNKYNDSNNKKFIDLIKKRLYQYFTLKKRISFKTFFNFIELMTKMLFLQKILNKYTKLNPSQKKNIKKIFKDSNKNLKKNFQLNKIVFDKYYFDLNP